MPPEVCYQRLHENYDRRFVVAGRRGPALTAALASIAIAAGIALWVNLDDRAASVPPYAGTEKKQG